MLDWLRYCVAIGLTSLAVPASLTTAQEITRQTRPPADAQRAGFEITDWSDDDLARLKELEFAAKLGTTFELFVVGQSTPMLATTVLDGERVIVEPRFELAAGMEYEVRVDLASIRGGESEPLIQRFAIPRTAAPPPTVSGVFPSGDRVPQNLLRMYVRFSVPMRRGQAADCIRFLDAEGQEIADAWLNIPQELWDASGRQFTILFDPGRIKRGLQRHEQLGLPFQPGETYTLEIDRSWQSADGTAMAETFRHPFAMTEPDRQQPDLQNWKLEIPEGQSREPLRIDFGEPLNRAMLDHAIQVRRDGESIPGSVGVESGESAWSFLPEASWLPGEYTIEVNARLEDLAGNSVAKPFEVLEDSGSAGATVADFAPRCLRFRIELP